ncbi:hypothetical protein [Psychrobacter sp. Sarcosine-3u-12]|uniref:hypothetical protein n=1 Tax=Psychrobacter sp. Sarcosine-3u-12 TaxID=2058325 RepID=UPI000C321F45|nr:hypothetical protein [Psychrobacter sp. Sarcosine-3u-12]PKG35001.1 hypothetical protein CXF65_09380 [Psychrobacter sp. Sarcosine-3u-12]
MIGDMFKKMTGLKADNLSILEIEDKVKSAKKVETIPFNKSDNTLVPTRGNVFSYNTMTTNDINNVLDELNTFH